MAAGRGLHRRALEAFALGNDVEKCLAVESERHRAPQIRIVEGRLLAVDDQIGADAAGRQIADRVGPLVLQIMAQRYRQGAGEGQFEFPGDEGEQCGRAGADDRILDAVEIGQAVLPITGVARDLDVFVGLELDEFERAGADRMLTHLRG